MYKGIKVSQDIESIPIDKIEWETEMLADPRDYKISKFNVRTEDSKALEENILEVGFRFPILSDENKEIINGGRRLRIAVKHGWKIPVIHRKYGEGVEADLKRAVDAYWGNKSEPNTEVELSLLLNKLLDHGIPISSIKKEFGIDQAQIMHLISLTQKPEEAETPEEQARILLNRIPPVQRKTWSRIERNLKEEEKIPVLLKFVELSPRQQDELVKDYRSNVPVDIDKRVIISKISKEHWEINVPIDQAQRWKNLMRSRKWDKVRTIMMLMNALCVGRIHLSQEDYEKYGSEEFVPEEP